MLVRVDAVGFEGKKEILYGLTKAAQQAKDIEYYSQPSLGGRLSSKASIITAKNASMKAYLDMAINDGEFKNVVSSVSERDMSYIKALLVSEKTEHSFVEPMKRFAEKINEVLNEKYSSKARESMSFYINQLLQKIKS